MKDKLLKWKSEFGTIYTLVLEETDLCYRTLTSWEVQSIVELRKSSRASGDIELATCIMATLWPQPLPSFVKPGTISTLASEIWENSVSSEDTLEDMIKVSREWAEDTTKENFGVALASVMCRILPSLDFAHLLDLPTSKLNKLAAIVELITDTSFMTGGQGDKGASPVTAGHGISQDQADQASSVLSKALSDFRKKK